MKSLIEILGCFFHLAENLWKHMGKYGLVELYHSDRHIYKLYQWLKALAFVPLIDVVDAFKKISNKCPAAFSPMLT